jgi:hypothetical protein
MLKVKNNNKLDRPFYWRFKLNDFNEFVCFRRFPNFFVRAAAGASFLLEGIGNVLKGRIVQSHHAAVRTKSLKSFQNKFPQSFKLNRVRSEDLFEFDLNCSTMCRCMRE